MYIAGVRFADLADLKLYVLDFNARFPLLTDFRVSPRLRLGYRKGDTIDLKEYTVLPSILIDYYWTKDFALEFEVGSKWTSLERFGVKDVTTELFLTAGFRYDFYADDKTKSSPTTRAVARRHGPLSMMAVRRRRRFFRRPKGHQTPSHYPGSGGSRVRTYGSELMQRLLFLVPRWFSRWSRPPSGSAS